jgi:hypothetical protein
MAVASMRRRWRWPPCCGSGRRRSIPAAVGTLPNLLARPLRLDLNGAPPPSSAGGAVPAAEPGVLGAAGVEEIQRWAGLGLAGLVAHAQPIQIGMRMRQAHPYLAAAGVQEEAAPCSW